MQEYSIHIDSTRLSKLLQTIFEQLPKEYYKAYTNFIKSRSKIYHRESLISKWIATPVSDNVLFKKFQETHRLRNIIIPTVDEKKIEFQIYLNRKGIIGVEIGEDLENLIIEEADISQFSIEKNPVSKYITDDADLEYFLDEFSEIDDYLDNKFASAVFTVDNKEYYSIITLSDKNSIVIDQNKSVYLLNKFSGLVKSISTRPEEFVRAFRNKSLDWFILASVADSLMAFLAV